jgi:uncharacterized protein YcbK (DUF882 family)
MRLSKNFTLEEMSYSSTADAKGISNYPDQKAQENLKKLCKDILQPIRDKFGKAIYINSGYRNPQLNRLLGGSQSSQHITGAAADIDCNENKKLWDLIVSMINSGEITVGQLIWEKGNSMAPDWIHISLPYTKVNQILKLK